MTADLAERLALCLGYRWYVAPSRKRIEQQFGAGIVGGIERHRLFLSPVSGEHSYFEPTDDMGLPIDKLGCELPKLDWSIVPEVVTAIEARGWDWSIESEVWREGPKKGQRAFRANVLTGTLKLSQFVTADSPVLALASAYCETVEGVT